MNIAIVGEAWGVEELKARTPFVGYSGRYLTTLLRDAGINRRECLLTNVFQLHPAGNDLDELCGPKAVGVSGYPALHGSKYVREEYAPELKRLADELVEADPNVVIALGNTALWAMLGKTGISKFRGVTDISTHTATGFKVLPTYHPMAVLRQISLRPTVVLDLAKALRESEYPELRRPHREIFLPETIEDLYDYRARYLNGRVSCDIETIGRHITCFGVGPDGRSALVIPFFDSRKKGRSYWPDSDSEEQAWKFVKDICEDQTLKKVFQNGMYDIAFLYRSVGIRVLGAEHDTMLLHHALQPESLKSLGFLGSIYTDEGAWKQMRDKVTTIKRDE